MSKAVWPYPGARWWKFDFHTHTPASFDTYWAKNGVNLTPEKWLIKYMEKEIDCVAVTDHNSGAWIDRLKEAYAGMKTRVESGQKIEGFREIFIFPGVEITVHGGVHLLAIFDLDKTTSDIDTLLGKVGFSGTKGKSDDVTSNGIAEVIRIILDGGGIPIPAHADRAKGLLQVKDGTRGAVLDPITIKQALSVNGLLALEWLDPRNPFPEHVASVAMKFAQVLGSDSHNFQGDAVPGSRYTWVKMARPSLEGLRLALLDGNGVSLYRSDDRAFDPTKTPSHFIVSIEINNARFMGRAKPEKLEFSPFYNALIGGRGTGKSTIVHSLRLAYRRDSELGNLGKESEPARQFKDFVKKARGRNDAGALLDDTIISVELIRDGRKHRLRWQASSDEVYVEEKKPDGSWEFSLSQDINSERFPARIFSQGQIASMANEGRRALLNVIDDASGIGDLKKKLEEERHSFYTLSAQIRELKAQLKDLPETNRKLEEVNWKIEALKQTNYTEILEAYERVSHQQEEVSNLLSELDEIKDHIDKVASVTRLREWQTVAFDASSDKEILEWRKKADRKVREAQKHLISISESLADAKRQLENDTLLENWKAKVERTKREFDNAKKMLAEKGIDDPNEFKRLIEERRALQIKLENLKNIEQKAGLLETKIILKLLKIHKVRKAITEARANFIRETLRNNNYVKIEIVPYGFDAFVIERDIRELLEIPDDRFKNDILEIDSQGKPTAGLAYDIASASNREVKVKEVKKRLLNNIDFGGHFQNHLRKKLERPEFTDHIKCWFPEDDLRIEYSRKGDGRDWVAIEQGSQGQRAAALLAFLLSFGEDPLILDQPEDDLDNELIYNLIVRQIRENKLRRQLIIVTHNPNIVVNGDAEMVHTFDFKRGQCRVVEKGALQEMSIREKVCQVMEGGREAFECRWRRLGIKI